MSYCSECGAQLSPTENFCHKCGHHVEEEASEEGLQPVPVSPPSEPPRPGPAPSGPVAQKQSGFNISRGCLKIGLIVLASFVAVAFLIIMAVVSMTSGPVKMVESHIAALKAGSLEEAYGHTSAAFRANTDKDQYRQFILNFPILQRVSDTSFPERNVENDRGNVKGNIIIDDGSQFPVIVDLIKEDEAWKILAIDFSGLPRAGVPSDNAQPDSAKPVTGESSIGTIIMGAGRNPDGSLINPGQTIPSKGAGLAADIEMINHPRGEKVEVWIVHPESGVGSAPVEGDIEGAGSGTFTYDLSALPADGIPVGKWIIHVRLAGKREFEHEFDVR